MHDLFDLPYLIFGNHNKEDIRPHTRVGSLSVPRSNPAPGLIHDRLGYPELLGKYHNTHINILNMHFIYRQRKYRRVYQRIYDDLNVKHKQTDSIYYQIQKNIDLSHADIQFLLQAAYADDVRLIVKW